MHLHMDPINVGSDELIVILLSYMWGSGDILDSIAFFYHIKATPHIAFLPLDMFLSIMHRNQVKMGKKD